MDGDESDAQARRSGAEPWRAGGCGGWDGMQRGAGALGGSYEGGAPGRGFGGPAWRAGGQDGWGGDSGCGMSQTDWGAKRGPGWTMGKASRDGQPQSQFDVAFLGRAAYTPLPSVSASTPSCSRHGTPASGQGRGTDGRASAACTLGNYAQPLGQKRPATRDGAAELGSARAPLSRDASPPRPVTREGGRSPSPPRVRTAPHVSRVSRSPVALRPRSPPREPLHLLAPLAFGRCATAPLQRRARIRPRVSPASHHCPARLCSSAMSMRQARRVVAICIHLAYRRGVGRGQLRASGLGRRHFAHAGRTADAARASGVEPPPGGAHTTACRAWP